jgi:2-dehydropantoate 2-reductase
MNRTDTQPPKRIALIGPGAVGCCLGAALLEQGHELIVAARHSFAELKLTRGGRTLAFPVRCAADPQALADVDLAILATKAQQTSGARGWLSAAATAGAPILIAQNGIDHCARVGAELAAAGIPASAGQLVPAVVYLPAHRVAPGHAVLEGPVSLALPSEPAAERFASAFGAGSVRVDLVEDWLTAAWIKLLLNAASGAITTPLGRSLEVLRDPEAAELARALIAEAARVGRAEGARLADDIAERLVENMVKHAGHHYPSITQDRLAGLPGEWQARNQVIADLAARHGIDVPLNRALTTLLRLGEPTAA